MRDRSQQMPGAVFVSCILGIAIIWAGVLRLNRFVPTSVLPRDEFGVIKPTTKIWPDLKIDINTASAAKIELLPGIGPNLAQRIIDYRRSNGRFLTLDDLQQVYGIGKRKIERLMPYAEAGFDKAFEIAKHSPSQNSHGDYQQPIQD
ncbi:MAG: ComEA family DNA-binding protein [Planctomycetes bacterium]|nr:ComEA family DNA-binding protein [Planctomycetota bacterium]